MYNAKAGEWQNLGAPNRSPFLAWGGWSIICMSTSKNPYEALQYAAYVSNKENSTWDVVRPSGFNPWRYSHMEPKLWTEVGMSQEVAESYLTTITDAYEHPNRSWDIRIPGTGEYYDTLEHEIVKAYNEQISPQQALDNAAAEWERITDRLGRSEQAQYYEDSLALER